MRLCLLLLLLAAPAGADTLVAARTIRAMAILGPQDLALIAAPVPGALTRPEEVIGMESRVILYAGRPIRPGDIGPPAIVERNQIVLLHYRQSGLSITTEGRALGRAGAGDVVRVMNLASRTSVTGRVSETGEVFVGNPQHP
ncbi:MULTISPECIES: flagellar basal body P-ring formation chaperone FlgA [Actibacterium]|uniref:Flagella basal body P-ring formation protein FlgA n=1 Tax=Actibacterium naphthalenivorans TaxID=1614693 RepID=A0A840CFD5_9RHOB|nr:MULTISPECIES: flagellar basal body P-ring formation chaperone FlgA [Actibacterium]ALG88977.1 flagellar basal body P-ring biosynthesis protein FlgA [Actibacterium sp. EMB200-NS6]MBB4021476.1 flagella basal body P-ring formation protein FlgA [Actibacterium naphthalenivorans]